MSKTVYFWRRTDVEGLERLGLSIGPESIEAHGTVLVSGTGGFRLEHRWLLTPDWTVRSVDVDRWNVDGQRALRVERSTDGWRVDGRHRSDLDGAVTLDLSATPFCNTFLIRHMAANTGASLEAAVAFIDGETLSVERSRQRYERQSDLQVRYIDLGLTMGFQADLSVDEQGIVVDYEHLFERVKGF